MNVRYGPSAPPMEYPCVMCNGLASSVRTFPCGCVYPIHEGCAGTFRRVGGVCPKCYQVWVPVEPQRGSIDGQTDTTYQMTRSQNEWLLEHHPRTGGRTICGCSPSDSHSTRCVYTSFCVLFLVFGGVCGYLLIRLYG